MSIVGFFNSSYSISGVFYRSEVVNVCLALGIPRWLRSLSSLVGASAPGCFFSDLEDDYNTALKPMLP
jgi:hypothetical protein